MSTHSDLAQVDSVPLSLISSAGSGASRALDRGLEFGGWYDYRTGLVIIRLCAWGFELGCDGIDFEKFRGRSGYRAGCPFFRTLK